MDGRDTYDTMTGFQMDLLLAIGALGQPSGLDVKTKLEEWYDNGDVHHGRLYPNLDELVKRGLVHKGSQDRRTNWYSLTEDGIGVADDRR